MSQRRTHVVVPTLMALVAFLWALPLAWVILLSLKPNDVLRQAGWSLFVPYPLTVEHYETLLRVSLAPQWLLNSFIVAGLATILTVTFSTLAGYALARVPFQGKSAIFIGLTAGMMIPEQTVFLPLHALIADWDLHNSYAALVAPRLAGPFGVLVMAQFFKAVPRELEEAAILDHAGPFKILWTIMLPLSRPAVTTLAIFTFLAGWNDFLWPLVSATDSNMYTITVGLSSLQGNFAQSESLGFLMATAVYASFPMIIVYFFFQRHIVQGIAFAADK